MAERSTKRSRNALAEKTIHIQRGLSIYRVNASRYWQARIWISSRKCYKVRSTKETTKIKARQAAVELAQEILIGVKPIQSKYQFSYFADKLIVKSRLMVSRGERNKNYVRTIELALDNGAWGLTSRFGSQDIRELKTRDYQQFMEEVAQRRPDLSSSTRNMLMATFRNVLKIARDDGVIDALPSTPRPHQKDSPRAYFPFYPLVAREDDVYQQILKSSQALALEGRKVRGVTITDELYDLILFTTHSFVRPIISELYALTHADVTVADNPKRLLLRIRDGKTGYRVANTMPGAVSVYQRIKQRYPECTKEDFLFFPGYPNRETAVRIVQRQFRTVMDEAAVEDDPVTGAKYTIYSLRHTAICMRIILSEGRVNIFNLAKNAGTSVEQIERFYASNLPLSAEMAKNLQLFGSEAGG